MNEVKKTESGEELWCFFVGCVLGAVAMMLVVILWLPAKINKLRFFEGDGIRAIRVEKTGMDSIFVSPDPNSSEYNILFWVLREKFGPEQSAERVIYDARVKELVGWYGDGEKEKR